MATDFVMPRGAGQQQQAPYYSHPQHQRQQYRSQQPSFQPSPITTAFQPSGFNSPVSPISSASSNFSPTAQKNYITRQIRPLYVPAVLRPTEFPSKEPPPPPSTPEDEDEINEQTLRPNSSFMTLGGLSAFGRLSRRSTGDSSKSDNSNWNLDHFPNPTGAPTRKHWKPDHESAVCDHATCKRYFSYFTRRHHCRRCGNIFCDAHSAFETPLDQDANFNPRGVPSRACGHCYAQFKEWRSQASAQSPTSDSSSPDSLVHGRHHLGTPTTPVAAASSSAVPGFGRPVHHPEVAHSVPRDWNWSTF